MPRNLIKSDLAIRSVKEGDPRGRINDGDGLYILLFVKGGSHGWRFDYTHEGRRKTLSLGTYPDTGLALARQKADAARRLVAGGVDPSVARQAERERQLQLREMRKLGEAGLPLPETFEHVARQWYEQHKDQWAPGYRNKIIRRFETDVFPYIGRTSIAELTPPKILEVIRRIENRGVVETAHRAHENCSQVFRFAVASGLITSDPSRDLKGALKRAHVRHFPAILDPSRLGELMRAIEAYRGSHVVRAALALSVHLLLRPGEIRKADWREFDLDAAVWTIPSARMKGSVEQKARGRPHVVPLPTQVVAVLRDLHPLTGPSGYVFPGERHHDRPMSENTVNAALRLMGFTRDEVTAHGFRATARTLLDEKLGVAPAVIEAQLGHSVKDALGTAYNRTEFMEQRTKMMQTWADYLDKLRRGARVIPMRAA